MDETKAQKLKKLEALQEKARRLKNKKPIYKPHEGQLRIHTSTAQERWVWAANSGGKTTSLVHELFWNCVLGENPYSKQKFKVPNRSILVLDSPFKIKDTILPAFNKWFVTDNWEFQRLGKPFISRIKFPNGSTLQFYFTSQDPTIFESSTHDGICATDEPVPGHLFSAIMRGARDKTSVARWLSIGTPIINSAWMRKMIYIPWTKGELPNTDCITYGIEANKDNLPPGYIESFARKLSESEKKARLEGGFLTVGGAALAHLFTPQHVVEPFKWPAEWPVAVAIDCHMAKPHHFCIVGVDPEGQLFYLKEGAWKMPPAEFGRELRRVMDNYKVVDVVCDSLGSTPSTGGMGGLSFIDVINQYGCRARATSFKDKDTEDFMSRIAQVLELPEVEDNFGNKVPKLRIFNNCKGIVNDIENVTFHKVPHTDVYTTKLDIENTDYLATLKYALTTIVTVGPDIPKPIKYAKEPTVAQSPTMRYNIFRPLTRRSVFTKSGKIRR